MLCIKYSKNVTVHYCPNMEVQNAWENRVYFPESQRNSWEIDKMRITSKYFEIIFFNVSTDFIITKITIKGKVLYTILTLGFYLLSF